MPIKLPTWDETVEDLPAWEETFAESEANDLEMAAAFLGAKPEQQFTPTAATGVSAIAGGPQRRIPSDLSFGADIAEGIRGVPSAAGELTTKLVEPLIEPLGIMPHESFIGLSPERVPSGKEITEATGITTGLTVPVAATTRALAGLGQFLTSPVGIADIGVAAIPGIGLAQRAKFIKDMAHGAGETSGRLSVLVEEAARNPEAITVENAQEMADESANTLLMLYGAGKLTSHQFSQLTGIRAPLGRVLESEKTRLAKDVAEQLKRSEPLPEPTAPRPVRQLGIPEAPLTAEPFLQPGVTELAGAALREAQGPRIEIPGQLSALETLRREIEPPRIVEAPTQLAERLEPPRGETGVTRTFEGVRVEPGVLRSASDILLERASKKEPTPDIIGRLESLKLPETGEGQLFSLPHPEAIRAIGVSTWNSAIDVAILAVRAGKALAQAVDEAVKYLRRQGKQFDENQIRSNLEYEIKGGGKDAVDKPPETPVRNVQQPQVAQEGQVSLPADASRPSPGQTLEPPTATKPASDPTTGEPAKLITEKASRAMESKVKIPAQADVTKVAEQINLFLTEIGDALETGGRFLAKELRPAVAKGAPAERATVTSKEVNQYFVNKLSSIRKQMQATRDKIAQQADIESQTYFNVLQERFEQSFRQVQELRRASHESLYFWNKIKAEYQEIARAAGEMPEMKRQLPVIDQIWKDFREKHYPQAGRHLVDYLRMNLFTMGSWTLDFGTNLVATASRLPAWAVMDMGALVTGKPATRMLTATRALADNMRNWKPGERFRLPEQIESELGTTAGGEFAGRGREVMVDFSEILKSKPELADKLRHVDKLIAAPVRMKGAVDGFFGRFGATAELYNRALIEGKAKGLRGDELKAFTEQFVQNPPPAALERAIKQGKELKFNRDLTKWEEQYASSVAIKLFVESFPRWTLQFIRWSGEMTGANPAFFKRLMTGKATPEDVVNYLAKAATGWAGIYAFNHLFYDNIDANTMEYVKEDGDRVRLAGRTPAPELFFISALLRGDMEKAKAALAHLSLPGAKLLSGEPAGIISPLIDTIRESIRGRYTAEQTARELTKLVNDAIPGKSVLGLIRSIFDPTIREGIGAPIPGVASLLPQRINPTTGEPLAPKQKIPGTALEIPTVGGTPFPGAVRVLNEIESTLMNHGLSVARPRRTSIIELPAEDVPKDVRREYEQIVGRNVQRIVGDGIQRQQWKDLPFEARRLILSEWLEDARLISRVELARKHGTSARPAKSTPLNVERMPERLRE